MHQCYRPSRLPRNPLEGAPVDRILGYRWNKDLNAGEGAFEQIPFQVDEKFTRFITNNISDFAWYSGVDKENTFAFDREAFRYTSDAWLESGMTTGDPCLSRPASGTIVNGKATTLDPVKGLDDDDELVFMDSDAADAAPVGTAKPTGIESMFDVKVVDPTDPVGIKHVYVALAAANGPVPAFGAGTGYVKYERDANADVFAFSQSSYEDYGKAPKGPYCEADGSVSTTYKEGDHPTHGITIDAGPNQKPWAIEQRRPLDRAWVKTPRYWFRYDGRWLMTGLRISPDNSGLSATPNLGPDIIDQWKARAFQQRPGGETPCCGYEEEVNNWGGSSMLFGERVGPVRAIRAAWGADSSTNNIKTEVFYRDEIRFQDNLRVHVIPPLDGIYVQWDYNAGRVDRYFNPWKPEGVKIDGKNDEVFGNTYVQTGDGGVEVRDSDPIPVVGPQDVVVGDASCNDFVCNDIDLADPLFSGPAGNLNWEEVAGPNGTVVTRWTVRQHSAGDAYSVIAQPYYRDDSCFDDGTGSDPGPHLHGRGVDDGAYGLYNGEPRVCWDPDNDAHPDVPGDSPDAGMFWQGDIATHGLHLQFIADSDNAAQAEPLTEIDSEQRMVVLPPTAENQGNVGDLYGRAVDFPLVTIVTPYL
jgi:hypothetical protein